MRQIHAICAIVAVVLSSTPLCQATILPPKNEKLSYTLSYLGVTGGSSVIQTTRNGSRTLIYSSAASLPWIDRFYPVRNYIWCEFDGETLTKFTFHQSEGARKRNREVYFDRKNNKALFDDITNKTRDSYDISPSALDPLSAFFAVRWRPLPVGQTVTVDIFDNRKNYTAVVEILRKEQVTVGTKAYNTIVIKPKLMTSGIFLKRGDIFIYLTDDDRRLPVLLETKLLFGSIRATLDAAE